MEARRLHRRDVLENAEVEPEELEDTSQVILFPSTGENILMKWRGQNGEAGWEFGAMQMLKDGEADVVVCGRRGRRFARLGHGHE